MSIENLVPLQLFRGGTAFIDPADVRSIATGTDEYEHIAIVVCWSGCHYAVKMSPTEAYAALMSAHRARKSREEAQEEISA